MRIIEPSSPIVGRKTLAFYSNLTFFASHVVPKLRLYCTDCILLVQINSVYSICLLPLSTLANWLAWRKGNVAIGLQTIE